MLPPDAPLMPMLTPRSAQPMIRAARSAHAIDVIMLCCHAASDAPCADATQHHGRTRFARRAITARERARGAFARSAADARAAIFDLIIYSLRRLIFDFRHFHRCRFHCHYFRHYGHATLTPIIFHYCDFFTPITPPAAITPPRFDFQIIS
jgi:hypothetical protein